MQPSTTDKAQISFLLPDLERQLDPRNALFRLARAIDWRVFEKEFRPLYCTDGRLGLAIRRLVGLLMHKAFSQTHRRHFPRSCHWIILSPKKWFFLETSSCQLGDSHLERVKKFLRQSRL